MKDKRNIILNIIIFLWKTIVCAITLKDKFENMGAQLALEISNKTNDLAGDGTTSSMVLGQAILNEGIKSVTAGMNPIDLKRGID